MALAQRDHTRSALALGENPDAKITCPRCGKGHLLAFEQRVGGQRFIHIWCSANEDHYQMVAGPRDHLFAGIPDLSQKTSTNV